MAKHQITLSDEQEKALFMATEKFNAPLLLQDPPGATVTIDEFLQNLVEPFARPLVTQVQTSIAAPFVEAIRKAIAENDDTKLAAAMAALEITPE